MRLSPVIAALLVAASPIHAASHTVAEEGDTATMSESDDTGQMMSGDVPSTMIAADAIEDAIVYSLGTAYDESLWDGSEPFGPVTAEWAEIGDVEDLILAQDGQVVGVTVDVGGFLGLGERTVLVPIEDLRLVQSPDEGFFIVTRMQRSQFEAADEIDGVIGR